ncbi:metal-dependent transcriptional regulator [Anaerosphaera multitolerans]|uniref:metal-dependent transcriptional regulator n=1 Tax=Anaerosphaera multitolerans TaxID=2487351 RepID=UPI001F0B7478|nr:MarR family transcriptional regulator [Anaerosphaera multitolerans]
MERDEIRNIDIANRLGVARATVTSMIRKLSKNGYIQYGDDKLIKLTKKGRNFGEDLYMKHLYLTDFLINIGIDKKRGLSNGTCDLER